MKQIKFLMLAMLTVVGSALFTACDSDDDNKSTQSNYDRYQQAVNQTVNNQKKNDKVILLVAFGSTWEQAYDTFDKVVEDYKASFSGWDVYLSFSSAICINNARAGENVEPKDYYDPEHWLTAIGLAGYKQVVVQSLQVIPGEEYRRVRDSYVKDFMNNRNGDFTDAYMKSLDRQVVVGTPLMAEESDAKTLAATLNNEADVKAAVAQGIVAFMGHGNPEGYDYYGGNVRYLQLENYLRDINTNYYVGTVDMEDTYVDNVLEHVAGGDFDIAVGDVTVSMSYAANGAKKAQLYPLMSIAGDHAHNDMADPDDDESWFSMFNAAGIETAAYETNYTEACWKKYKSGDEYIPGLAERSAVRKLWMNHTREAIKKLGTDEALSTPTTAAE
ncbi:sirohydrochlorin cobaltochelatase [Xylanibacter ruminicola]|uniref:Sirohydrochlorin cobaltochelatase n=1 Tax=Xylanibacter ruminicola TaxID=839 RepID=A0A1M7DFH5_XYLRU|nr:sirohydrochlorin cobaltochelatase [Xylanibacter ruminicola]SFB93240.1 sirohydrochlorin cobaltochelatase [Xylanibacter ruminicola]SHL78205.1 sirohydrochlorin cobaltochelatase [Xylanibacter ruminicola]